MELSSLYDYYQRKFRTADDNQLRKRIMAFPENNLGDLSNKTLVRPSNFTGLKVVEYSRIDGFTHTNAGNTVAVANGCLPITIERYHEEDNDKLTHPELPLLAVRIGPLVGGGLEYEYLPIERVYYCEVQKARGADAWKDGSWTSSETEDETELEETPRQFGQRLVSSEVQEPAWKKEEPVKLDFQIQKVEDVVAPITTLKDIAKTAPAGRGIFSGPGGSRPSLPLK